MPGWLDPIRVWFRSDSRVVSSRVWSSSSKATNRKGCKQPDFDLLLAAHRRTDLSGFDIKVHPKKPLNVTFGCELVYPRNRGAIGFRLDGLMQRIYNTAHPSCPVTPGAV